MVRLILVIVQKNYTLKYVIFKGEDPCLVYQLMAGSLEQRLFGSTKKPALVVQQRINIAVGTAR